jgi:peptide/nickel transport system permease protein
MDVITGDWERRYGLGMPPWRKALIFYQHLVKLDLGTSFRYPTIPIQDLIAESFPNTLVLVICTTVLSLLIGIPLGIVAGLREGSLIDRVAMFISMIGQTIPSYVIASLLILVFAVQFRWIPTSGWGKPVHLIMPVLSLALGPIAGYARYMRSALVAALKEDYVRTAYAKGGTHWRVLFGHAFRNSLIPLITVAGPTFAFLMSGAVWIEVLFNIPGLGRIFASAAPTRDFPLVLASTFFFGIFIMFVNLMVDIAYAILDPRIRVGYASGR